MNRRVLGHVSTWWSSFVEQWPGLLYFVTVVWVCEKLQKRSMFQTFSSITEGPDLLGERTVNGPSGTTNKQSSYGVVSAQTSLRRVTQPWELVYAFFKSCIHSLHFIAKKVKAVPFATKNVHPVTIQCPINLWASLFSTKSGNQPLWNSMIYIYDSVWLSFHFDTLYSRCVESISISVRRGNLSGCSCNHQVWLLSADVQYH